MLPERYKVRQYAHQMAHLWWSYRKDCLIQPPSLDTLHLFQRVGRKLAICWDGCKRSGSCSHRWRSLTWRPASWRSSLPAQFQWDSIPLAVSLLLDFCPSDGSSWTHTSVVFAWSTKPSSKFSSSKYRPCFFIFISWKISESQLVCCRSLLLFSASDPQEDRDSVLPMQDCVQFLSVWWSSLSLEISLAAFLT